MEPNRLERECLLRNPGRSLAQVAGKQRLRRSVVTRGEALSGRHADELVTFARMWLPYGGAPAEEIFEQFGMTTRRFLEALWASVRNSGAGVSEQRALAAVYPGP